jgi:hypothetical protein
MIFRLLLLLLSSLVLPFLPGGSAFAETSVFSGGHIKAQLLLNTFPDDSLFLDVVDTPATDFNSETRLKYDWRSDKVSLNMDYQMITRQGDMVTLLNNLADVATIPNAISSDDRRLFDLTHLISHENDKIIVHRLDRFSIDYTGTRAVARAGRQVVSWGNGLIYTPMDFFNPFDPAAVDKEYKTGDDMLYGQYLSNNGNDLQAVWVLRRDALGDVSNDVDSITIKYHGFAGNTEYDILLAEHYTDTILGIGGVSSLGGAIWRGDITLTETQTEMVTSLVTNLSYSWLSGGRNISGMLEYFFNGFGQSDGDYSPSALAANPDLIDRVARGELFTLGQHYVAASVLIEVTPLWLLTPNVFINASDGSSLVQLVSNYDFKQNWQFLAALSIPVGPSGTEYGGIDSGTSGKQLSSSLNLFAQLAWYF